MNLTVSEGIRLSPDAHNEADNQCNTVSGYACRVRDVSNFPSVPHFNAESR